MSIYSFSYKLKKFFQRGTCYLRAIPRYFDNYGWWIPHNYKEITPMTSDIYIANVYSSSRGLRMALGDPTPDEILIKDVAIRRFICKTCGKEMIVFADMNGKPYFPKLY